VPGRVSVPAILVLVLAMQPAGPARHPQVDDYHVQLATSCLASRAASLAAARLAAARLAAALFSIGVQSAVECF